MTLVPRTFEAPAAWASALINGDRTGLSDVEEYELEAWLAENPEYVSPHGCGESFMGQFTFASAVTLTCDLVTYTYLVEMFEGSFMQPCVEEADYFEVETSYGTEYVPADVCGTHGLALGERIEADDSHDDDCAQRVHGANECSCRKQIIAGVRDYVEGSEVQSVELKHGWLARMSAPGYMDCTDWSAHDTSQEAWDYLVSGPDAADVSWLVKTVLGHAVVGLKRKVRGIGSAAAVGEDVWWKPADAEDAMAAVRAACGGSTKEK